MQNIRKKLFLILILSFLLVIGNINPVVKAQEEKIFGFSLNIQGVIKKIFNDLTKGFIKKESYKEKYFKLLREFAELKLKEKEIKNIQAYEILKRRYPNAIEAKTLKIGGLGKIYLEVPTKNVKANSIVLDENFLLVGKVSKVKGTFLEVETLETPGIEFNIADINNIFLGIGRTTGLGYIELELVEDKKIEEDSLVMTYGNDKIFPPNFIFGRVMKIEKTPTMKKIIIELLGNFSNEYYFIIP